jgi:hypothetical protein
MMLSFGVGFAIETHLSSRNVRRQQGRIGWVAGISALWRIFALSESRLLGSSVDDAEA